MSSEPTVTGEPEKVLSFTRTPSIARLAAALAKAQGEMQPAKKDSENPFFKSHYADLAAVWAACRQPLSSNGLAVLQFAQGADLVTLLAHSSGESVEGRLQIQTKKDGDVQSLGSTITYLRRYALAAMVGVVAEGEDDDGNAGSGRDAKPQVRPQQQRPAPVRPQAPAVVPEIVREREPGSDDATVPGEPPRAAIPVEGSPAMDSPAALGAEVMRLMGGSVKAAGDLLEAIAGVRTARGMKADAVRMAWTSLAGHPTFGRGK